MIIAHHEGLTLRQLDKDSYCLSGGRDCVGRCSGTVIGRGESVAVLQSWGGFDKEVDEIKDGVSGRTLLEETAHYVRFYGSEWAALKMALAELAEARREIKEMAENSPRAACG